MTRSRHKLLVIIGLWSTSWLVCLAVAITIAKTVHAYAIPL
ncbi:MAG TPA: hypothetical protein VNT30_22805 [Stellaceae bacterium]|nr:hypothetical protein [Stellaceae bacterium]